MIFGLFRPAKRKTQRKTYSIPAWLVPRDLSTADMHRLLRRMLDSNEPKLVRFLQDLWKGQGELVTVEEMRLALETGQVPHSVAAGLRETWEKFATDSLLPVTTDGARAIGTGWAAGAGFTWEETTALLDKLATRAATWATELPLAQSRALAYLVQYHAQVNPIPAGELAARIRSFIGLRERDVVAVLKAQEAFLSGGATAEQAALWAERYASHLRQARALTIARTELAYAARDAQRDGIEQLRSQGLVDGNMVKEWSAAEDEATCPICGDLLNGLVADIDGEFVPGYSDPPAHPNCRCVLFIKVLVPKS